VLQNCEIVSFYVSYLPQTINTSALKHSYCLHVYKMLPYKSAAFISVLLVTGLLIVNVRIQNKLDRSSTCDPNINSIFSVFLAVLSVTLMNSHYLPVVN